MLAAVGASSFTGVLGTGLLGNRLGGRRERKGGTATEQELKMRIDKNHFRVAVFGSARIRSNSWEYKLVYTLARMIAKEGMDIVTGGGPGLMDAASRGQKSA